MFTDAEALLMMQNAEDRNFARAQILKGNACIKALQGALADAYAEIENLKTQLKREKGLRHAAEFAARRL